MAGRLENEIFDFRSYGCLDLTILSAAPWERGSNSKFSKNRRFWRNLDLFELAVAGRHGNSSVFSLWALIQRKS